MKHLRTELFVFLRAELHTLIHAASIVLYTFYSLHLPTLRILCETKKEIHSYTTQKCLEQHLKLCIVVSDVIKHVLNYLLTVFFITLFYSNRNHNSFSVRQSGKHTQHKNRKKRFMVCHLKNTCIFRSVVLILVR